MFAIQVNSLTKVYKSFFTSRNITAVKDLTLSVEQGKIFGLLGPNGAGKTTLIKVLLNICFPTSGRATIFDTDIFDYRIKKRIGYLPENHKYPNYLTGEQVLNYFGKLSGIDDKIKLNESISTNLELVGMAKWRKTKIKKYSKGMMQRLGLAQALISDPDLIFLDEPTDGVDPIGRKEIRDILQNLKAQGKTIFLNSHLLSEVEMITDKVAILNKGELIREGNVSDLTQKGMEYQIILDPNVSSDKLEELKKLSHHFKNISYKFNVNVANTDELNELIDKIRNSGVMIESFSAQKTSLEDLFINLIKESDKKE
ncbi:MAG: ABC transporter ATP-binding protein [Ignavibacteria bacterium]|nr:ABC transporter ATP-binding protein [Ignavibacteria bacterium]